MCGIFGYANQSNSAETVLKGLRSLEYRGYDSWGICASEMGKITVSKDIGQLKNVSAHYLPKGSTALGHTRWATHGGVTIPNAHPHLDCTGSLAIIHNGIVENFQFIKSQLKNPHTFASQTDSEVVIHLVEELLTKHTIEESIRKAFQMLKGSNAFVFLTADGRLIAIKNGSPLVIGLGKNGNLIASDASSLIPYAQKAVFLEDGQMALINKTSVKITSVETGKPLKPKTSRLDWNVEEAQRGKYKHFMLKEINEQPETLQKVLGNQDALYHLAKLITEARGVFYVGCGTAAYVAQSASYLASKIANLHTNFVVGSEFKYQQSFLNKKSLVIAVSQSGETIDVVEPIKKAKSLGVQIAAITNVYGSTIYRLSKNSLLINAGVEKAVASTKSFTGMIGHLIYLDYILAGREKEGRKVIEQTADAVTAIISPKGQKPIKALATKLKSAKDIYLIGRGLSYPAVLEAALKLKEVSYIHSEGFAGGELKHGAIALIEKGTPTIVFAPNDETYDEIISNATEIKARGGTIIGISTTNNPVFDYFFKIEDVKEGSMLPMVVIIQLLAYYLALEKSINPDMPRNLAKSVTVK